MAAASSTSSVEAPKAGQSIGKYRLVRELGARTPHAFAANVGSVTGESELVVVEILSLAETSKEGLDAFARRARRLALVRHPNLARVREVLVTKDRVVIASDFVDGELLGDLLAHDTGKKLGLVERLRVLVDVLSGLSSIHLAPELPAAADKEGKPPLHGALDPESVVVGSDGSSRLIHVVRAPAISGKFRVDAPRYTAPELLLGDETSGVRADLYAAGVLLWETLSGRRLFDMTDEKDVLARQLAGPLPLATVPDDAPWAKPLVDVAARALDVDPEKRHASAAELAGALRLAVQARLAPASRVGAAVASIAREKIQARAGLKAPKRTAVPKNVRVPPAPATKIEAKASPKPEAKAEKPVDSSRITRSDAESTEKKPVPAIARSMKTRIGVPSLAADDEDFEETKRVEVDSIAEDDLFSVEEVATAPKAAVVKKSMPPPLRPKSMAPPAPPAASSSPAVVPRAASSSPSVSPPAASSSPNAVVTATPPPAVVSSAPPVVVPTQEADAIATMVVTPAAEMTSAPAADAVAANDSKIEVIPPADDPQKKKRRAIVMGVVGAAALLLLIAVVKHGSKDDGTPKTSAASKPTTSAHAPAPTTTAKQAETATAAATTPPAASTFVAEPVPTQENAEPQAGTTPPPSSTAADTQPATSHPSSASGQSSHSTTPTSKPHKHPPHSSYEPEGI